MKQVADATDLEGVTVQKAGLPRSQATRTDDRAHTKGRSATNPRCSLDPMRDTDRYRLVTPYFDSSKDL